MIKSLFATVILLSLFGCQPVYQVVWESDRSIVDGEFDKRADAEKYVEYYKEFHEYKILVDYRLVNGAKANVQEQSNDSSDSERRLSVSK